MAPEVGFEPTTNRLTADRSTTELLWIALRSNERPEICADALARQVIWLRGLDLNQRPSGYEPDELPGCSTPRLNYVGTDHEIKLKDDPASSLRPIRAGVALNNAVHDQQQSVSNPRDLAGTASSTSSGSVFRHAGCERAPFATLAARGALSYQIQPSANGSVRGIRTHS